MSVPGVRRVLVPIDFSDRCVGVVRWAIGLTREVAVVHVLPPLAPMDPAVLWGEVDDERRMAGMRHTIERWLADHTIEGVGVHVLVGAPAQAVVALAGSLEVDLIALPSQRRPAPGLFSLGSVTERIVRTAPCSVWVDR